MDYQWLIHSYASASIIEKPEGLLRRRMAQIGRYVVIIECSRQILWHVTYSELRR